MVVIAKFHYTVQVAETFWSAT